MSILIMLLAGLPAMADDGLVAHYSFDGDQGSRLTDTVAGHHGIVHGAEWKGTAAGRGLLFDGTDDHVDLGDAALFRFAGSFTIELWVLHTSVAGWQDYVGNYVGGASGYVIAQNEGSLHFHQGGMAPHTLDTGPLLEVGVWHHVAAVYDHEAGTMKIYLDGTERAAQAVTGTPVPSEGIPLSLGRYHDGRERFYGAMDELRIWSRALSEAEMLTRYAEHAGAFKTAPAEATPTALPEGVLMGMALHDAEVTGDAFSITTTGASFTLEGNTISCRQRIPAERETARIVFGDAPGPFELEGRTDFACRLRSEVLSLTAHGDSVFILTATAPQKVSFQGLFTPGYHSQHQGRHLFIDETGGFGIYPVKLRSSTEPDFSEKPWAVTWSLDRGDEIWLSIFPPRPYNHQRSFESLAHEGGPEMKYPTDELIEATARNCKTLTIHSYIFPGGDKAPWRIPRFHPADIDMWHSVREKIQSRGMRVIPYFSPFYYDGSLELTEGGEQRTYFDDVRDALDVLKVDGLYFDGVSMDFRKSYWVTRKTRQMIGDDRILYVHCSTDPLGVGSIYCPFIDTYADYILRGEAGRAGLDRDAFLRWVISSYNIGNAVGIWCYYGSTGASGYRNIVPRSEDIDAALACHARLWRQGMAWGKADAGKLEDFDREYYNKLNKLRQEHEARQQ